MADEPKKRRGLADHRPGEGPRLLPSVLDGVPVPTTRADLEDRDRHNPDLPRLLQALRREALVGGLGEKVATGLGDGGNPMVGGLAASASRRVPTLAFHGSPRLFDRFDVGMAGTRDPGTTFRVSGEPIHGLHFTDDPSAALQHARLTARRTVPEELQDRMVRLHGYEIAQPLAEKFRADWGAGFDPVAAAQSVMQDQIGHAMRLDFSQPLPGRLLQRRYEQMVDAAETMDAGAIRGGHHAYDAALDVDPARVLDWDLPMGAQNPRLQGRVENIIPVPDPVPAKQMYRYLADEIAEAPDVFGLPDTGPIGFREAMLHASRMLRDEGVHGVRATDPTAFGGRGGTEHVLFDDRPIRTLRRHTMIEFPDRYADGGLVDGPAPEIGAYR